MKELSIEEKAKLYDEAIKRLEDIKTGKCQKTFVFTEGLFDYIFPELREESEGIRKYLISFVELNSGVNLPPEDAEQILAWLEKQGQKPVIEMKSAEESLGTDSETYNKIVDECVYGEPKPTWSEEDEVFLNLLLAVFTNEHPNGVFTTNDITVFKGNWVTSKRIIAWLKHLKERYAWKPSDEQIGVLLSEVSAWTKGCPKQIVLESLYNDLLKLKG